MDLVIEGLRAAMRLIVERDPAVMDAATRSLAVSLGAVAVGGGLGVVAGTLLATTRCAGRGAAILLLRMGMGLPTVLIGLVGYALLSRRGPLGDFALLYSQTAIIACEAALAFPIVATWVHGAIESLDARADETARMLGAGPVRRLGTLLLETRTAVVLAFLTAFARCFSELGIAMIVGGNIKGQTRTLATATALETQRGELGRGIAMGLILLVIAAGVTACSSVLDRRRGREGRG